VTAPAAPAGLRGGRIAWQLAQTLWVGGIWVLFFVLLPALQQFGLAPLLVEEIAGFMQPLIMGFAAVCVVLQLLVIGFALGRRCLQDMRAQLLLVTLLAVVGFFALAGHPNGDYMQQFTYLVAAFCGLILTLQPRPDETPAS